MYCLTIFHISGVSYTQKFHGKHEFPNFANCKNSQFMFPKYLDSTKMQQ